MISTSIWFLVQYDFYFNSSICSPATVCSKLLPLPTHSVTSEIPYWTFTGSGAVNDTETHTINHFVNTNAYSSPPCSLICFSTLSTVCYIVTAHLFSPPWIVCSHHSFSYTPKCVINDSIQQSLKDSMMQCQQNSCAHRTHLVTLDAQMLAAVVVVIFPSWPLTSFFRLLLLVFPSTWFPYFTRFMLWMPRMSCWACVNWLCSCSKLSVRGSIAHATELSAARVYGLYINLKYSYSGCISG